MKLNVVRKNNFIWKDKFTQVVKKTYLILVLS